MEAASTALDAAASELSVPHSCVVVDDAVVAVVVTDVALVVVAAVVDDGVVLPGAPV